MPPVTSQAPGGWGSAPNDGMQSAVGNDRQFVPAGLNISALAGGNGGLTVVALTLRRGPSGTELYAALSNRGDRPACSAAFSVELFDRAGQSLSAGIGSVQPTRFYRLADEFQTIAACVAPGERSMATVMDLAAELAVSDVSTVVYRCPHFALEGTPVDGLTISTAMAVSHDNGTFYRGTLVNNFEVMVTQASVSLFTLNRVGRPLSVVTVHAEQEIPPGGTWNFETEPIDPIGASFTAYPAGVLAAEVAAEVAAE